MLGLKRVLRAGWTRYPIPEKCLESVADHTFGVLLLSWLLCPPELDRGRVLELALLHDLPEVLTGDITPHEKVDDGEKRAAERAAMHTLTEPFADSADSLKLLEEYQTAGTPEARWVKAMDKLEMVLQSLIYEDSHGFDLSEFRDSAAEKMKELGLDFSREKSDLAPATPLENPEVAPESVEEPPRSE